MAKNENQLEALLKAAARQLGTNPEDLKSAAENGTLSEQLKNNMSSSDAENFNKVLSDPQAAQKLLSTPQAQALIKLLKGNK